MTIAALPVSISNPGRVIFPEAKITKGDLAGYYHRIAPLILPWVVDRPISLVRCPQGRAKQCFFQKHDTGTFGPNVHHLPIREKDGGVEPYLYVSDEAGLLGCVQMGTIEFHGWGAKVADIEKPDRMVFDLDPDEALAFADVVKAAHQLRTRLAATGLESFPLLTGGKGVHVVVPIAPTAEWPRVKDFAGRFARAIATAEPDHFTATMSRAERKGRIFIDWLRNQRGSTAVTPYSARARPYGPVAAPVSWEELGTIATSARWHVTDADELIARATSRSLGDWGKSGQTLPTP